MFTIFFFYKFSSFLVFYENLQKIQSQKVNLGHVFYYSDSVWTHASD